MTKRRGGGRQSEAGIAPAYEGPEVLTSLLRRAGSPHGAEEVAETFARAQKKGEQRSAVIPGLFPVEPRFDGPDSAERLYANLFGLWARVEAGLGPRDDAPVVVDIPAPLPPLPDRGSVAGDTVPGDLVEVVWRWLAAAPPREAQRRRDRFQNVQPDLVAWLDAIPLPESGALAAMDLAFEAWAMLDQAFGDRLGAVEHRDLRELGKEPPILSESQPAIAAYVDEQLDNLADEDPAFAAAERALVEKVLAAVVAALTAAVRQPS
jgi:hypothetical protein